MDTRTTYRVIQELGRHESDVKAVLTLKDDALLACASRDGLISLWTKQPHGDESPFGFTTALRGHNAYVNSLAHIPPENSESRGWIASGGNSTMVLIHSLDTMQDEPISCLIGHSHNVCALHYSSSQKLLASASWDCTARIWKYDGDNWVCQRVLEGHQQAVWDVKIVANDSWQGPFITASADGEIWVWSSEGEPVQRLKCCPEPVRTIALLSTGEMASGSNDYSIASLLGHKDYIFQVTATARGMVSCGEDQTARVWDESGVQTAVLKHLCTSVWSVTSTSDELVITGGSDGIVRVWQQAPPGFVEEPAEQQPEEQESDVSEADHDDLGRGCVNHVVIDIDVADDQAPLQLVVGPEDDPATLARQFGEEHDLSENYIRRIEEFVRSAMPQLGGSNVELWEVYARVQV